MLLVGSLNKGHKPGLANGSLRDANFRGPTGLHELPGGRGVVVCDTGNACLRLIRLQGEGSVAAFGGTGWLRPRAVCSYEGELLVCDAGHHRVRWLSFNGQGARTFAGSGKKGHKDGKAVAAQFDSVSGVCALRDGRVLIADTGNHCIRCVRDGIVTTVAGCGTQGMVDGDAGVARFSKPTTLLPCRDGSVLIADTGNSCIRQLSPDFEKVSTLAGGLARGHVDGSLDMACMSHPDGLALARDGCIIIADTENNVLRSMQAACELRGEVIGPDVRRVSTLAGSGSWGALCGEPHKSSFYHPLGICCLSDGTILVADSKNNAVRVVSYAHLAHLHPRQTWRPFDPANPPPIVPASSSSTGKGKNSPTSAVSPGGGGSPGKGSQGASTGKGKAQKKASVRGGGKGGEIDADVLLGGGGGRGRGGKAEVDAASGELPSFLLARTRREDDSRHFDDAMSRDSSSAACGEDASVPASPGNEPLDPNVRRVGEISILVSRAEEAICSGHVREGEEALALARDGAEVLDESERGMDLREKMAALDEILALMHAEPKYSDGDGGMPLAVSALGGGSRGGDTEGAANGSVEGAGGINGSGGVLGASQGNTSWPERSPLQAVHGNHAPGASQSAATPARPPPEAFLSALQHELVEALHKCVDSWCVRVKLPPSARANLLKADLQKCSAEVLGGRLQDPSLWGAVVSSSPIAFSPGQDSSLMSRAQAPVGRTESMEAQTHVLLESSVEELERSVASLERSFEGMSPTRSLSQDSHANENCTPPPGAHAPEAEGHVTPQATPVREVNISLSARQWSSPAPGTSLSAPVIPYSSASHDDSRSLSSSPQHAALPPPPQAAGGASSEHHAFSGIAQEQGETGASLSPTQAQGTAQEQGGTGASLSPTQAQGPKPPLPVSSPSDQSLPSPNTAPGHASLTLSNVSSSPSAGARRNAPSASLSPLPSVSTERHRSLSTDLLGSRAGSGDSGCSTADEEGREDEGSFEGILSMRARMCSAMQSAWEYYEMACRRAEERQMLIVEWQVADAAGEASFCLSDESFMVAPSSSLWIRISVFGLSMDQVQVSLGGKGAPVTGTVREDREKGCQYAMIRFNPKLLPQEGVSKPPAGGGSTLPPGADGEQWVAGLRRVQLPLSLTAWVKGKCFEIEGDLLMKFAVAESTLALEKWGPLVRNSLRHELRDLSPALQPLALLSVRAPARSTLTDGAKSASKQ